MTAVLAAALLAPAPAALGQGKAAADPEADAGRPWRDKLGLSAAQVPKFLAAMKEREAGLQPLRDAERAALRRLQARLSESAPESDVQEALLQLAKARKAVEERAEKLDAGLAAFLSPSQRARLLVWRSLGFRAGPGGLEPDDAPESAWSGREEQEPE